MPILPWDLEVNNSFKKTCGIVDSQETFGHRVHAETGRIRSMHHLFALSSVLKDSTQKGKYQLLEVEEEIGLMVYWVNW